MTYRELMEEVAHLGFDSAVEDLGALCSATNRSLAQLHRELRPAVEHLILTVREPLHYLQKELRVKNGTQYHVDRGRDGVAITFESIGSGRISFLVGDEVQREEALASTTWRERRVLYPECAGATVVLTGENGFAVRSVAVYDMVDNVQSPDALPLLRCGYRYKMRALLPNFVALDEAPYTEAGVPVQDYELADGVLTLPECLRGRVQLCVRRKLRPATLDHFASEAYMDAEVDIQSEYADILPLCVASYVWADVEPEKAAYYKRMCDEQVQYVKLQQQHRGRRRVADRRGWR